MTDIDDKINIEINKKVIFCDIDQIRVSITYRWCKTVTDIVTFMFIEDFIIVKGTSNAL